MHTLEPQFQNAPRHALLYVALITFYQNCLLATQSYSNYTPSFQENPDIETKNTLEPVWMV